MSEYDAYFLGYADLMPHINQNVMCPECEQNTCSIKIDQGKLLYQCFRASCGIRGAVPLRGIDSFTPRERTQEPLTPYQGSQLVFFDWGGMLCLSDKTACANIRWNPVDKKYLLPIWSPKRVQRGMVERVRWGLKDYPGPKSRIYKEAHEPMISWYFPAIWPKASAAVLVEDQISAMRIAQDTERPGVALLGVSLDAAKVAELQQHASDIIIALDADATAQAFKLARKWGRAFKSCRVVVLERDVKDMSPEEVRAKFN